MSDYERYSVYLDPESNDLLTKISKKDERTKIIILKRLLKKEAKRLGIKT
jgi:hypothetical protein